MRKLNQIKPNKTSPIYDTGFAIYERLCANQITVYSNGYVLLSLALRVTDPRSGDTAI